jgi:hypothetical protein
MLFSQFGLTLYADHYLPKYLCGHEAIKVPNM